MPAPFNRGTTITPYVSLGIVLHFSWYTSLSTSHGTTDRFLCINYEIVAPIKLMQCIKQMSGCGLVNTNSVTWCQLHTELVISISQGRVTDITFLMSELVWYYRSTGVLIYP